MTQATVRIDRIKPPKAGKKMSWAECGQVSYMFDAGKFSLNAGESYSFEYVTEDFNGKAYNTIKKILDRPVQPSGASTGAVERGSAGGYSSRPPYSRI